MSETSAQDDPKRVVARGYDQVADAYASLEEATEWPRMRWLRKVLNRLEPSSAVLDLGCGSGLPAGAEIAEAHEVTGVDISRRQIDLARENVPAGTFIHGDLGSVVFPACSFDAVVSFYTLEHLPRGEQATLFQRVHSWLRPGGYLLFSTEAAEVEGLVGEWLGVPMFFSCFHPRTVKKLVQEVGFVILESAIEEQTEGDIEIPYLWLLARKPSC